jgi:hypothetical protein
VANGSLLILGGTGFVGPAVVAEALARCGLILGPGEDVGRLPWWLERMAAGGRVLCPGPADLALQYIDVRDLAAFALDAAASHVHGAINTVSPRGHTTIGELLAACHAVAAAPGTELQWVAPPLLAAAGIEPWQELPIWIPPEHEYAGMGPAQHGCGAESAPRSTRCAARAHGVGFARRTVRADHDTQRSLAGAQPRRPSAPLAPAAVTLNERVLALQRRAGNGAVLRALGLESRRTLARDPLPPIPDWTFSPTGSPPIDLYPWLSKDPVKRERAQQDLLWATQRPSAVRIDVTASGLDTARKTYLSTPPAPAPSAPATTDPSTPSPTSSATPDAGQGQPQTVPVATSHPEVKDVQVQVSWGLAGEGHTKPTGPGAGKDDHATTDWQSSAQVALTIVYHDKDKAGLEWSTQFQVNWSDTNVLRAMSPTALQNIQIGSQLAYVIPLWNNVQAQIFGQIMFGVGPDGKPVAQAAAGGQLQLKLTDHLSLFLQGNVGGTQNSGDRNAPSYTGDASLQGGVIYQW